MGIRIYNTLARKKQEFEPAASGKVGIYACGPTVYDYFHIGNARAFVVPDMVRRYLKFRGYDVTYVQNITDIEDKIIRRAHERGVAPEDIVREYTEAFFQDRAALGIGEPDHQPRATDHVPDIIDMVSTLIDRGLAYESGGDVYFDVSEYPDYGKLSGQDIDQLQAGARVDIGEQKNDPLDFALWKAAKPGEPTWDSPWGPGRPGWHIECSAMSTKYLGGVVDIHTGGTDLIFPHHENEIAQSEGALGSEFVRYWMHNAMVNIEGQRMGKSMGNYRTIRDLLAKYPGKVIRYYLISGHYRSPMSFSLDELDMCQKALSRLEDAAANAAHAASLSGDELKTPSRQGYPGPLDAAVDQARAKFIEAMDDDFNTPAALATMHELATSINAYVNREMPPQPDPGSRAMVARAVSTLRELGSVLGFIDVIPETRREEDMTDRLMELILEVRAKVRTAKMWDVSDTIRDRLKDIGIIVEDTREGARWKFGPK